MKLKKILLIAITFGVFQGVMPLIGYLVGFSLIEYIDKFVPWIALALLSFLGIKMIIDGQVYRMEQINQLGIDSFTEYFAEVRFDCNKVKYHDETGKISYMWFEATTY